MKPTLLHAFDFWARNNLRPVAVVWRLCVVAYTLAYVVSRSGRNTTIACLWLCAAPGFQLSYSGARSVTQCTTGLAPAQLCWSSGLWVSLLLLFESRTIAVHLRYFHRAMEFRVSIFFLFLKVGMYQVQCPTVFLVWQCGGAINGLDLIVGR